MKYRVFPLVYCFIVLSLAISASAVASYVSFLDYDHNEFNHIRTVTFGPASDLQPLEIEGKGRIGSIYRDDHKVIVAFSGLLPKARTASFNLGNICGNVEECYEGAIKRLAENINLGQYPQHEIIVSGNNSCSKLALLFAASQLSFSEPHQHKVVLFGVPEFSDRSVYASIMAKIKYKSDVLIFDYYRVYPRSISLYPGLIIEMTPRNWMHDTWVASRSRVIGTMLSGASALFCLSSILYQTLEYQSNTVSGHLPQQYNIKYQQHNQLDMEKLSQRSIFTNRSVILLAISTLICGETFRQLLSRRCIPSERSVQEAFVRFRETYPITSDTPLEEIGTLTLMQALRL